jgi:hypothetical protein
VKFYYIKYLISAIFPSLPFIDNQQKFTNYELAVVTTASSNIGLLVYQILLIKLSDLHNKS